MKLRRVDLDDAEMPERITVEMTVDEAGLLYALTGNVAPRTVTEAMFNDTRWGNALVDVAECLSGSFFNRYWDNGADGVVPRKRLVVTGPPEAEA